MKPQQIVLSVVLLLLVGVVALDFFYTAKLESRFMELEKQRVITSNKLATAKIVYENLNHVRDLVFKNMDFPGQKGDTVSQETRFFEFVTTCVNDLKLKLISVKPLQPVVNGRVTTYGYDIEVEGDFFKFGELCSKFENSRRIVGVETFTVGLITTQLGAAGPGAKGIRVTMRVNTYRVKKDTPPPEAAPGKR